MNSECLITDGLGRFSCPNLDELNFSYLMMALDSGSQKVQRESEKPALFNHLNINYV